MVEYYLTVFKALLLVAADLVRFKDRIASELIAMVIRDFGKMQLQLKKTMLLWLVSTAVNSVDGVA